MLSPIPLLMALVWGRDHNYAVKKINSYYLENFCKFMHLMSGWALARIHKPKHFLSTSSRIGARETQTIYVFPCPAPTWGIHVGHLCLGRPYRVRDSGGQQWHLAQAVYCKICQLLVIVQGANFDRGIAFGIISNVHCTLKSISSW